MRPPKGAKAHYRFMQDLQVATLAAGERAWRGVDSDSIRESWGEVLEEFEPVVVGAQVRAASAGASYGAETLVQSSEIGRASCRDGRERWARRGARRRHGGLAAASGQVTVV